MSFQFDLRWAKIGEEYLLYGNVVMIPYSCINANSINKSSFEFVGVGGQALGINWFVVFGSQLYLEFDVDPDIQSVSRENVVVLDQ